MDLHSKKVLVTGAGGFIGSHLVEALVKKGACVKALVNYNSRNNWGLIELLPKQIREAITVTAGDIRDEFLVKRAVSGSDVIFHLASLIAIPYSYQAPMSYVQTNIGGTINILQAAMDSGVSKIIHTSTSEVYGTAKYTPIDEQHPLQGQSPYAASKIGADKIAESFYLSFGLPVATIRPFNAYGPRQSARAVIPTIITQALQSDKIEIGLLSACRDFTFVEDTVDGFIRMATCDATVGHTVNIGSGKSISIGELVQLILRMVGVNKEIAQVNERFRPEKSEVMLLHCDNRKAGDLIDWVPETSITQGLEKTIAFMSDAIERYKTKIYNT